MTPTRKVGAGVLGGAASVMLVFLANTYLLVPAQLPPLTGEVASALTVLLTFVVGYLVPER